MATIKVFNQQGVAVVSVTSAKEVTTDEATSNDTRIEYKNGNRAMFIETNMDYVLEGSQEDEG